MKVDTLIAVGAGTAGRSALREVPRYMDGVLLINDGHWGTTYAAVGCMPSKALTEAASLFARRRTGRREHGGPPLQALRIDECQDLRYHFPLVDARDDLHRAAALWTDFYIDPKDTPQSLRPVHTPSGRCTTFIVVGSNGRRAACSNTPYGFRGRPALPAVGALKPGASDKRERSPQPTPCAGS